VSFLQNCQVDFKSRIIFYYPGVNIFKSSGTTGLVTIFDSVVTVLILK
jgi:hypothetical protein